MNVDTDRNKQTHIVHMYAYTYRWDKKNFFFGLAPTFVLHKVTHKPFCAYN